MQKTIYRELRKSPMSKFYLNCVERRDLASIRSVQMMKKSNDWIFLNKQKLFLTSPIAMVTAHTLVKMRE